MEAEVNKTKTKVQCAHCNDPVPQGLEIYNNDNVFCCHGCKTVFNILGSNGLSNFYKIRDDEGKKSNPVNKKKQDYSYLDDESFIEEFTVNDKDKKVIKFYLEGIHCMACLWLIEKTPSFVKGLISARLNMGDSTVIFETQKDLKLSVLAQEIFNLGYTPHPLKLEEGSKSFQIKEERKELLRIGVAGAALGNIMIYAVSNYAGADGIYKLMFNWISLILTIPVVLYSALPFYRTSLQAIKMKEVSIDIPLSTAIIGGFIFSTISMFTTGEHLYFDSISALIFLILLSRYFVKKATQSGLNTKGIQTFFTNTGVIKIENNGKESSVHSKYINIGDLIKVSPGEKLVFDVILESHKDTNETATVDNSIITGESKPQIIMRGEEIFAGSVNIGKEFIARVNKIQSETRIGKIIQELEASSSSKSDTVLKADIISRYFVISVFTITTLSFIYSYFQYGIHTAFARALSIIIISCPCALALATPLAFIRTMGLLKEKGIFVKNENVIEKLNLIKNIVLDKTGTITEGRFEVIHFENYSDQNDSQIHSYVQKLEGPSIHPIAISLKAFFEKTLLEDMSSISFEKYKNIAGLGVSAMISDTEYFVGKVRQNDRIDNNYKSLTQVGFYRDNELIAIYYLGDKIKSSSKKAIRDLVKLKRHIHIASGDHKGVVDQLALELSLNQEAVHANQSPEDKAHLIDSLDNTLMIGDGANDALALKKANIGIAVGGAVDLTLRASDIFLTTPSLGNIRTLISAAKETEYVIKRNFIFSITYNLVGVGLALYGYITPLWAAIFMPLSSLTVLLSSYYGTRKLNTVMKEKEV